MGHACSGEESTRESLAREVYHTEGLNAAYSAEQ